MKKPSTFVIILIASVLLNALLAGYVLSCFVRPIGPRPPMPYERMEKALKVISPEYRADIQKQIDASEDVMYKRMENMRPRFDKINTILTAEHFDREALKAAFNDMSKHNDMRDNIQNLLISIAIILPDEERAKFFMAAAPDGPPRGPGPGPGGPPECARP